MISTNKQDLINEIQNRVSDKIIEKTNADLLIKLIKQADNLNEAISIAELGTTYKKTGFQFDKRLEKMTNSIKYLKRNEKLSFITDNSKTTHKLIVGDNYDALLNLLVEYKNSIDVIYIDPPYGKDSMGNFAKTNYDNALTRDNLLSMLYPRLFLAKQILSDSGVIFCSIDDKNQAYVKGLFDEIFGESNFVGQIVRENIRGGSKSGDIKQVHDYVLCYTKDRKLATFGGFQKEDRILNLEDEHGKYAKGRELNKWGSGSRREDSPSMWFPIPGPNGEDVYPIRNDGSEGRWRLGKKKLFKKVQDGDVIFDKRNDGTYTVYEKIREVKTGIKQLTTLFLKKYTNSAGTKDLKEIFFSKGNSASRATFEYVKPVELIKDLLILSAATDDAIILDFFAGSGTTGQAVMELNREDGGNRQFILATSNETSKTTPNGIVNDVTSRRLKRVMTGSDYDGDTNFEWLKKNKPFGDNLDVYDIGTVASFETTEGKTPFDVIDETLYDQNKLNTEDKIKWICENFETTQVEVENDNKYIRRTKEGK